MKVVLITGTSTGVGLKSSILFAKKGYQVYASMRNVAKKEQMLKEANEHNVNISVMPLDVCSTASIQSCVNTIVEKEGRLDILINNAGAGFAKTTEQATDEEIRWVTDVNYLGVVRCSKAVLPHMRTQKSGHIINISSVGGLVGQPFNELYCAAKFAVEGYTEALASYVTENFRIKLTSIEPGGISTEFMSSALKKMQENGKMAEGEYLPILQKYIVGAQERAATGEMIYQTPEEVAEVVLSVAESPEPPLRIRTSEWAEEFCALKTKADPDGTRSVRKIIDKFLK